MPVAYVFKDHYMTCDNCWIFSLFGNKKSTPKRFKIKTSRKHMAIYQSHRSPCLGSTLKNKQDLYIKFVSFGFIFDDFSFDKPEKSLSCLGYCYNSNDEDKYTLAGSYTDWDIHEIEVYSV